MKGKKSEVRRTTFELSREVITALLELADGLGLWDHDLVLSYAILYAARSYREGKDIRERVQSLTAAPTLRAQQEAETEASNPACRDCGRVIGAGGTSTRCARCAAEHRSREAARARGRRKRRREEGLCTECGWRPREKSANLCIRCNELNNKHSENYRARKRRMQ